MNYAVGRARRLVALVDIFLFGPELEQQRSAATDKNGLVALDYIAALVQRLG